MCIWEVGLDQPPSPTPCAEQLDNMSLKMKGEVRVGNLTLGM